MTARERAARLLASSWRGAGVLAGAFAAYAVTAMVARDRSFPEAALSPPGVVLGLGLVVLLLASALAPLADPRLPPAARAARLALRSGLALMLAGVPASVVTREVHLLQVSEHQDAGPELAPGLGPLRFGPVTVAPRGDGWLLSKTVSIEAARPGGAAFEIGLWPAASLGPWRLTVLRYGFAPEIDWRDGDGRPVAEGYALIGTFPSTEEAERLVAWTPVPRLMLGVGYFPPALEDLLTPPGTRHHLFLRLDEATLGGARRDLRSPEAHRWLADGPAEDPVWWAEVFRGDRRLHAGRLRTGESARFEGGGLRLGETARWVEIQAVRDPLRGAPWWGAALAAGGALLLVTSRCRAARPRT